MNPHYQYAILERFSNADATLGQVSIKDRPILPISNRPTETRSMSKITESPLSTTRPLIIKSPLATTRPLITETVSNVRPTTVRDSVDVAVPVRTVVPALGGMATINLVNPIRLNPVASLEDTIESSTSESTTKSQGIVTGGGGGVGEDSEEEESVVGQPYIVKSIFPLVVIAIGISIIIFKPIK